MIVVGAHLDSVGTGTGINDNGSGSSAILEIAEQLRGVYPRNKIRFMWFGAEESGLLGSEAYVASLPDSERQKIAAMLNVPAGGLFTGAEGIKMPEQEEVFGGTAGEQYDPCYHLGCDDLGNLSTKGLDQMSDAAAHSTITLAQQRSIPDRPVASAEALRKAFRGDVHDHPEPIALDPNTR